MQYLLNLTVPSDSNYRTPLLQFCNSLAIAGLYNVLSRLWKREHFWQKKAKYSLMNEKRMMVLLFPSLLS